MNNPIVGIGELLWDVFPGGRKVAGGAPFNFAFHCRQLGHEAVIVSRVGADDLGRELRDEVRRLGLSDEYIQTDPDHPTGTVRVTVDAAGQPTYTITEDVAWDHVGWEDRLSLLAANAPAVCFGTLASRSRTPSKTDPIPRFLLYPGPKWGQRPGLRVFDVNLRQHYYNRWTLECFLGLADWVKLNTGEMQAIADLANWGTISPHRWYRKVYQEQAEPETTLIVTAGELGTTVVIGRDELDQPAAPAQVVDTVGAGDAFTAAMVCLHLEGRPLRECARFANHYAARVCEHQGATPRIDRADVDRAAGLS
jgi:fructokinase